MKKNKNLSQLHKDISRNLLESLRLIKILDELNDGEAKYSILIDMLQQKISTSFNSISKCQRMISLTD